MDRIPIFSASDLEAVCKVIADTTHGLKGDEIGYILADMRLDDADVGMTKWKRLFNALVKAQNKHQVGNHLIMFINRAMTPSRYVKAPEMFDWRRDNLNVVLSFSGYCVREDGKVALSTKESTLSGARARAGKLKSMLEQRGAHAEVFRYCNAELLEENYFHAVFEAIKGLAQRIRDLSALQADGSELVQQAFSVKTPIIAVNSLKTESEQSEQKGVANLMIGLFSAVRNPTAHSPKILWAMPEQDALDVLAIVSYLHRKLDTAVKV
jgi:uncharacterized protein (TIGR02391 family)